jgi:preprotein translocase subunit SecA
MAHKYLENVHYIIGDHTPNPVDYDNTGKVEHSTHWANGLHQFLQLKHFLKLTPENLTTNFISNIKYFQLYEHLTGVTGTLGSQKCRETLSNTYDADIVIIPDSYEKQLIEYPLAALENTDEWVQEIKLKVQYELQKNRGVLIICETIEYCNYMYYHLSSLNAAKIKLYTMNGKDQ